jgi:hypothetical protein
LVVIDHKDRRHLASHFWLTGNRPRSKSSG